MNGRAVQFIRAIDLCGFLRITDIEICGFIVVNSIEMCIALRRNLAEKCGAAQCYIEKTASYGKITYLPIYDLMLLGTPIIAGEI